MTNAQCRMARAALDWTIQELALAAGVNYSTIVRFEGGANIYLRSRDKIAIALGKGGVAFFTAAGRVSVSIPDLIKEKKVEV